MLQLSQLDLQLAFASPRSLRENIQNQRGAIQHLAIEDRLQIPALSRREFVIENDSIDVGFAAMIGKFRGLSFADKRAGARGGHFLQAIPHDLSSGGGSEFGQFLQGVVRIGTVVSGFYLYTDEEDSFGPAVPGLYEGFQISALFSLSTEQ
jgi:hypothetical protein